jgi:hypothetical protein
MYAYASACMVVENIRSSVKIIIEPISGYSRWIKYINVVFCFEKEHISSEDTSAYNLSYWNISLKGFSGE